jgi:chromosome partitioning protein
MKHQTAVVTVANTKGGVGKSTVSGNLAWGLAHLGCSVMLVDADAQASVTKWFDLAEGAVPFDRCQLTTARVLQTELSRLRRQAAHDVVVIDCPPLQSDVTAAAVSQATLGLIPVLPSPLDVLAYADLVPLLRQAQALNPDIRLRFVVNQLDGRTALSREVMESLTDAEIGDVSTVHLHYLQEYRKVVALGTSVVTRRGAAASEIQRLATETVETLGLRIRNSGRGTHV